MKLIPVFLAALLLTSCAGDIGLPSDDGGSYTAPADYFDADAVYEMTVSDGVRSSALELECEGEVIRCTILPPCEAAGTQVLVDAAGTRIITDASTLTVSEEASLGLRALVLPLRADPTAAETAADGTLVFDIDGRCARLTLDPEGYPSHVATDTREADIVIRRLDAQGSGE